MPLRAAQGVPDFHAALACIWSRSARRWSRFQRNAFDRQRGAGPWHKSIEGGAGGPADRARQRVFDALPTSAGVMCADGWSRARHQIDENDKLHFSIAATRSAVDELLPSGLHNAKIGEIFEWREDKMRLELAAASRISAAPADHRLRPCRSAIGDTLQRSAGTPSPIRWRRRPGRPHAHVDFQALALAARHARTLHGRWDRASSCRRLGIDSAGRAQGRRRRNMPRDRGRARAPHQ